MSEKMDLLGMTVSELSFVLADINEKPYRAKQIYDWLHNKQIFDIDKMANIPNKIKNYISDNFDINIMKKELVHLSGDNKTKKYLLKCTDDELIEVVLLSYRYGNSLCISSQVGCNMGCAFCASTVGGKVRNLKASEMLSQIYTVNSLINDRVSHIVVMGMGEPLDNFDNFVKFVIILTDEKGYNLSRRNITVSTCGIVPKIYELADLNLGVTLAISLHCVFDEKRQSIMPVAKKYSIREIIDAAKYYFQKTKRRLTLEYSLINGFNDGKNDAKKLAEIAKELKAHINLIPVNRIDGTNFDAPSKKTVYEFKEQLEKLHTNATIRRSIGDDIAASCGQLKKRHLS